MSVVVLLGVIRALSGADTNEIRVCGTLIPAKLLQDLQKLPLANKEDPRPELAILRNYTWPRANRVLTVAFLDGDPEVQQAVLRVARKWSDYLPVQFRDVTSPNNPQRTINANIRISFKDSGSWSQIGVAARAVRVGQATMNFGWLSRTTSPEEYDRVVLHEFGHALGAIHEHQSPRANIQWKPDVVKAYYIKNYHWRESDVILNILTPYTAAQADATDFDPTSIMLYAFPAEFTENHTATAWNTKLSEIDIKKMRELYPN